MPAGWLWRLLVNRWLGWVLVAGLAALIALTTLQYQRIEAAARAGHGSQASMLIGGGKIQGQRILNDFEDFYVVGEMYREGDILSAYDNDKLLAAQQRLADGQTFMPWAYPPQMTALVPLLPLAGLAWSYLLFMGGTLALFVAVLRAYGPTYVGAALLAVYPALVLNARLGQNGFLTGALIGLFLLAWRARRDTAGVPLGLMVIKPHMGLVIGLMALLKGRYRALAIAVAVVVGSALLATLVVGPGVWSAFLGGAAQAGVFLKQAAFPLYRMSSVYAGLRSFGASPDAAMAGHGVGALVAVALVVRAHLAGWAIHRQMALGAVATLFVSPYNYDYDFACLTFALALMLPELMPRMRVVELVGFYVLCWIGSGAGMLQHFRAVLLYGTTQHPHGSSLNWSFQAIGIVAAAGLAAWVLRRPADEF
jgi:hypothetical protein